MKISVIIPAFNEEANIQPCLLALDAQTLPKELFEIIVVDNGSTDQTVSIAHSFAARLPLRVLSQPRCSISEVRNIGAASANGEILAFLDADCMPRPDWLENSLTVAQENTLWGAHYLIPLDATWVGRTWFQYQATDREGPVSFVPGGCLFLTHRDFDNLGGFDPAVETSEDVELCTRARERDMQVLAFASLSVYHEGTPRTLGHFYRQSRWHGKHVLRVFLAKLPSTENLPLIALTFYTLVMFWVAIFCLPFGIYTHRWLLAFLPVGLLLLPSLILSLGKTAKPHRLTDAPALFILYITYFLARGASLARLPFKGSR